MKIKGAEKYRLMINLFPWPRWDRVELYLLATFLLSISFYSNSFPYLACQVSNCLAFNRQVHFNCVYTSARFSSAHGTGEGVAGEKQSERRKQRERDMLGRRASVRDNGSRNNRSAVFNFYSHS